MQEHFYQNGLFNINKYCSCSLFIESLVFAHVIKNVNKRAATSKTAWNVILGILTRPFFNIEKNY